MANARRAAGLAPPPGNRFRWPESRVIEKIQILYRSGVHLSQNAVIEAGHRALVLAACARFGSWSAARERAGVPSLVRRQPTSAVAWSARAIVDEIVARVRRGQSVAVTKTPNALVCAAQRFFGSWREAIEAAGLDYASVSLSRRWTDAQLLDWLRRLSKRNPRMLLTELAALGGHGSACKRRWGSLDAALRAAGLDAWPTRRRHRALDRERVLRALRARARAKKPMNLVAARRDPAAASLVHSALRIFATWDDAITAAGLPLQRRRRASTLK